MKIELEQVSPHEIEKRSFEIITEELNGRTFPEDQELVVKRCIHTSADFDYADNLCFSEHAVEKGIEAIREGACIVTDTQMARSGINKKVLARHGGEALCFMSDEDVAARAKETGSTRAAACMEKAAELVQRMHTEVLHGAPAQLSISGSAGMGLADACGGMRALEGQVQLFMRDRLHRSPETLCTALMSAAMRRCGGVPQDDMTVCCTLFKRRKSRKRETETHEGAGSFN